MDKLLLALFLLAGCSGNTKHIVIVCDNLICFPKHVDELEVEFDTHNECMAYVDRLEYKPRTWYHCREVRR